MQTSTHAVASCPATRRRHRAGLAKRLATGENNYMAQWIARDMATRSKQPRDYALLVRQLPADFEAELQPAFNAAGLTLRNESRQLGRMIIQDLLVDSAAGIALAALRLGLRGRNAQAWARLSSAVYALRDADEEDEEHRHRVDAEVQTFLAALRIRMRTVLPGADQRETLHALFSHSWTPQRSADDHVILAQRPPRHRHGGVHAPPRHFERRCSDLV